MQKDSWASAHRLSRRAAVRGFTAAAALAAAACGGATRPAASKAPASPAARPVRGGTLTLGLQSDIASLDPLTSSLVYDRRVQYHVFDSLIATNKALQLVPALALSWETADPTSIVFKLRSGVQFHDGTDFTADAVRFNVDRILQTPASPRQSEIAGVTAAQAIDPSTVRLVLKSPSSPLLSQLVDRAGMMLSPAAVQKLGAGLAINAAGAGTGPFKFVEYKKDDHVTLTRNGAYWGKDASGGALPYLDQLIFRPILDATQRLNSLRSGEIDFADSVAAKDVAAIEADPSLNYRQIPALSFNGFYLNNAQDPFRDLRVRQALAWSIDRQQLIDTLLFKIPVLSNGPIAPLQFPYDPTYKPYTRDVNKAKALLTQAGHAGVTFTMLIAAGSPSVQQQAELFKDQVKDAGFTLDIQALDFATLIAMLAKGSFQAGLANWSGRIDPDGNTYLQFHSGSTINYARYANPAMDQALEDARATFDQGRRKTLYQQVNRLAAEEAPYVFTFHDVTGQYSTAKIKNFTPVADGIYRFHEVWKQT